MPRVLKAGDKIRDYSIVTPLNTGAMANAFAAQGPDGRKVFFKQYKSPAVGVEWFSAYVEYQKELNRRVMDPLLKRFCVHQLDSFVFKFGVDTFFQAYEFIEGGHDLGHIIEKIRKDPASLNWQQRLILAKVMMAGIHQLHEQKIAHCDLKPPNLQMLVDPSIKAGYQVKLIDMDFSVLSDRKAPWDGHVGYVGSPHYFSPEHLNHQIPGPSSDIFTCGLILYELLGDGHPYPADDDAEYAYKVKAYKAPLPKMVGALPDEAANTHLATTIRRCLSPKSADRPTAKDVNLALNGKGAPVAPPAAAPTIPPPVEVAPAAPVPVNPVPPPNSVALKLSNATGGALTFNVSTPVGQPLLRQLGEEARFAHEHQYTLDRRGVEWWLAPQNDTPNHTLLNGTPVLEPTLLKTGDKIELGSRTTGRTILPLIVTL